MSEHIVEAIGLSKVTIKDGKVIDVSEPKLNYCPLFHHHRGMEKITKEAIWDNIQFRIDDFGMCTSNRQLRMKDFLSFGISEILSTLIEENAIDCAVMVCEGCGTLIVTESELVQGIGGRVSGLVKTSPIPELFDQLGAENILEPEITLAHDCLKIQELKKAHPDVNIYIFVVHTSNRTKKEAIILFDACDVATACASKYIREIGEAESLKTVGQSIPIYSKTEDGKKVLDMRLEKIGGEKPKKENPDIPDPLL